jgi:uncharacterized membrane protein (UPF0127 family)
MSRRAQKLEVVKIVTKDGDRIFWVEVAITPSQRARGLMFRTCLSEQHGMLFDFGHDQEKRMWMENTLISLDIIFIQSDGIIHRIEHNTEPGSLRIISSNGLVRAALEVGAGVSKKYDVAPGDRIIHQIFSQ